jgi:hypothetical protein
LIRPAGDRVEIAAMDLEIVEYPGIKAVEFGEDYAPVPPSTVAFENHVGERGEAALAARKKACGRGWAG